jgi:hypothetical protein
MKVPPLSDKDVDGLLGQPLVAKVASVSSTGDMRVTPIWFGRDGDAFVMNTFEDSGLVKNLRHMANCSLMVDSQEWPYIGVHYWGMAKVEGPENDVEGIAKLFAPYRGSVDEAREYAKTLIGWGPRVYVRFTPKRRVTWDFRG